MIKFETHELELFIAKVNPSALLTVPPSEIDIGTWNEWLHAEDSLIKKEVQRNIQALKPRAAQQYVQLIHLDLLRLMDMVEMYGNHPMLPDSPLVADLYQNLQRSLEKIFIHLLKYYAAYIDQDLPLPNYHLQKAKTAIDHNFQQLKNLYARKELDKSLLDVAFRPLNEFLKRDHNQYSYRTLLYFQEFINEWLPLLDMTDKEEMNWQVHYKLYYLNFNNIEYRIYCTRRLHEKLEVLPSLTERIQKVNWYVTTLRRLHQKSGMALLPGQPSIVPQVLSVIEEEFQYLVDQENLQEEAATQGQNTTLQVPLTSLQLAQLANILDTIGFFPDAKPIDIIRFFAANFSTIGQKPIRESSFHTQYYAKSIHTLESKMGLINWVERIGVALKNGDQANQL